MDATRLPFVRIGRIGAEPHRAAEISARLPDFLLVAADPFAHQADRRIVRLAELGRTGALDACEVPRGFDHCELHAVADPEARHLVLARISRCPHLPDRAALAKPAGKQHAIDAVQLRQVGVRIVKPVAGNPVEVDLHLVGEAAVAQRFDHGFVGVVQRDVFADDGDGNFAVRIAQRLRHPRPVLEVRRVSLSRPKCRSTSRSRPRA